jgi:cytochrome c oxidase cbb3-type subunit 3/ubiquinol-cytochrome c reductase cytochrome c subunit
MRLAFLSLTSFYALALAGATLALAGCSRIPGRPGPGPEVPRPDDVLDFRSLYKANCAACHGENGSGGAAISLSNPVYLAVAGEDNLRQITANGVSGKLMPPFARSAGGMLTDQQIGVLAHGMIQQWSKSDLLAGLIIPQYRPTLTGDGARGQEAFGVYCAGCHGAAGEGSTGDAKSGKGKIGSIVDGSYLALISDQGLRSIMIAGRPDEGMPDWRTHRTQPMTDQQITDIVAWLASKRTSNPGQPYPTPP